MILHAIVRYKARADEAINISLTAGMLWLSGNFVGIAALLHFSQQILLL